MSVDDNQLKCCCDQSVQLKQLRLVNLTENDAQLTLSRLLARLLLNVDLQWTYCFKTINVIELLFNINLLVGEKYIQ